jgi:predicted PurR-regulated permease PerM
MDVTLSPRARATVVWIGVIVGGLLLFQAAHALRPFAWAVITAYIFHPLVARIHRKTRLPKHLITAWLFALLGLIFTILLINLSPVLVEQVQELQEEKIEDIVDDIEAWLNERPNGRFAGIEVEFIEERLSALGEQVGEVLGAEAVPLLLSTFTFAIELFVYLIASFYLIVYGDRFVQALRDYLNRRYHREFDQLLTEINSTLGAYLRGQVVLVVIMSTASYVALRILDVEYALSVAIATGFLELIPLIGPWAAGSIAVTIALFQDTAPFGWSNGTLAIVVGLTYFALRQLEDAFVIPQVIGRFVHLHPLLVIFVLVIGTSLGGVLGLLLAVPMAATLKILIAFFYAKLMAREVRHVEVIRSRDDLERVASGFPDQLNATIMLLIEPEAIAWDDLGLVQRVAEEALDHGIALSTVTPDGIAGALATAAGIPTATIPTSLPVALYGSGAGVGG